MYQTTVVMIAANAVRMSHIILFLQR